MNLRRNATLFALAALYACASPAAPQGDFVTISGFNPGARLGADGTPVPSPDPAESDKLFHDPPPQDEGWPALARLLQALTPSVDTSIPLTPSQITDRIAAMLNAGRNQEALEVIEKRMRQRDDEGAIGTDVQLMFLHGRALAALGRDAEAQALYLDMTTRYPELPEPWNNLAVLYVKHGNLAMARDALEMALTANPSYGSAQANLGRVQLMLAEQSFEQAARLGVRPAASSAAETRSLLDQ